jgi:hypothetical protein
MTEMSREDREKALSKAYNDASQQLREEQRDRFNTLYSEAAARLGVEWKPRLKPEEKAEQDLLALFDAFPDLRRKYAPVPGEDEPDPATP